MRKIWSVRDKWNGEWIARIWKDSNLLNSWIVWFKLSSADSLRFNATLMYMKLNNSAFVSILFVSPGKDFRWNVIAIFDALGYKWCFILYWIMCNNKVLLTPLKVRTTNEPLYSWIIVFFSVSHLKHIFDWLVTWKTLKSRLFTLCIFFLFSCECDIRQYASSWVMLTWFGWIIENPWKSGELIKVFRFMFGCCCCWFFPRQHWTIWSLANFTIHLLDLNVDSSAKCCAFEHQRPSFCSIWFILQSFGCWCFGVNFVMRKAQM